MSPKIESLYIKRECLPECICFECDAKYGFRTHQNIEIPLREDTDLRNSFKNWSTEPLKTVPGKTVKDCRPKCIWYVGVVEYLPLSDTHAQCSFLQLSNPETQMPVVLGEIYKNWKKWIGAEWNDDFKKQVLYPLMQAAHCT